MFAFALFAAIVTASDLPEDAPVTPPPAAVHVSEPTPQEATNPPSRPTELSPIKPPPNETFGLRVGPSTFAENLGWNQYAGSGLRMDFVGQLGRSNLRFLGLVSLEASYLAQVNAVWTPTFDLALIAGAGFRDDTNPQGPTAFLFELAGIICGDTNATAYPLGLHLAMGVRLLDHSELLLSGEFSLSIGARASAAIAYGRSF